MRRKRFSIPKVNFKITKSTKSKRRVLSHARAQSKTIDKRQEKVKRRKNYIASLVIIIILWLLEAAFIYFVDPYQTYAIAIFFVLTFINLAFTLSFMFINSRRGLIATLAITVFLLLRYFGMGNVINLVLLLALSISAEMYFGNSS